MNIELNDDLAAQVAALKAKFRARAKELGADMQKAVNTCCLKVERDIKESMSPNGPSAPGEPPAVDTGRLRASITHRVEMETDEVVGYVGTNVDYAGILNGELKGLEFGTERMAPRPFLVPAIERNKDWIAAKLKAVVTNPASVESDS